MKHTICCPQGRITIWSELDQEHGPIVRATIAGPIPPVVDLHLHPDHADMVAQAFFLAVEECSARLKPAGASAPENAAAALAGMSIQLFPGAQASDA